MAPPRTWLVIPAIAITCAAIALATQHDLYAVVAIGGLGAGIAAAVRAYAGSSLAAGVAGCAAGLLGTCALLDTTGFPIARSALAGAAAMFTIAEIARLIPAKSPFPAIGAALVAAVLDPSFVGLVAIAGIRFVIGPWPRPRWAVAVPIFGGLAIVLAILCGAIDHGVISRLWLAWTGHSHGGAPPAQVAGLVGDALGTLTVIAAVAGLAVCTARGRFAAAAIFASAIGAVAVDLRDGVLAPATLSLAALAAGIGIYRLAATVRWTAGQAFVGATASFLVLVAPVLGLAEQIR